jgi:type IV pilus assembly protein PilA
MQWRLSPFLGLTACLVATSPSCAREPADSKPLFRATVTETGYDMSLEELSRDGNRSRVRVENRRSTSVGGSVWTLCQMGELTDYRGFRYHVVLDEVIETASAGGERFPITVTYDLGFLDSDAVDLKAEFGIESSREIVDIEEYALICGETLEEARARFKEAPIYSREKEEAYLTAMKSDLKNLTTAQEAYFADNVAYTTSFPATIYTVRPGVTAPTITLTADGWTGWVAHGLTAKTCAIYIGTTALAPANNEGEPKCTP